ncbi:Fc receptor-like protein 5 isoform X3 [Esox lucius]|uniref:Fc receptor-like protein 5 isoform X3 n=1 Tax=Esox lucius TaxID=8010 RepID=UPI001476C3F7|nr:Fc receptor-like protein 5 isoform X3 [Esox lucius]
MPGFVCYSMSLIYSHHPEDDVKPKPVLSVSTQWLNPGHSVTLRCRFNKTSIHWRFFWYRNVSSNQSYTFKPLSDGGTTEEYYTLSPAGRIHTGRYVCGAKEHNILVSEYSEPQFLWSGDLQSTVSLTVNPNRTQHFTSGTSVSLSCEEKVNSTGWRLMRYTEKGMEDLVESRWVTKSGSTQTQDSGVYWCESGSGENSNAINITVTDGDVILESPVHPVTEGDTVTLVCKHRTTKSKMIKADFYKDGVLIRNETTGEMTISAVSKSNEGFYKCKSNEGKSPGSWVTLIEPKPVLSVSPQWLNPGDSVTLRCQVKETSTDWNFFWYRIVPSDRSYTFKPLSDDGTTEEYYTLSPAGRIHTGEYVCRAGRGNSNYTDYSEPQFLWSGDLQPAVSLTVAPKLTQHFTKTPVLLTCEDKGNPTGWRVKRYTQKGVEDLDESKWVTKAGSTWTIKNTLAQDSGVYWCESGSGENSNAVNITVTGGDVILESPVHPVTEGDTVTLVCKHRTTKSKMIKADFYKDGVLIRNETTGEMTISVVSKSDEGFYKCTSNKGESPGSWVTVTDRSSILVLVGVVGGLVVAGFLLGVLLVLVCQFKNSKGSCCNRTSLSPQTQITNQDHQQDLLQHGGANIYETIYPSDNTNVVAGSSSASGTGDVTYVQIQLNQLKNNKKGNTIYSEVKTGKATESRLVEENYAQIDLNRKAIANKKRGSTPRPETEPIYSEVMPGTAPSTVRPNHIY